MLLHVVVHHLQMVYTLHYCQTICRCLDLLPFICLTFRVKLFRDVMLQVDNPLLSTFIRGPKTMQGVQTSTYSVVISDAVFSILGLNPSYRLHFEKLFGAMSEIFSYLKPASQHLCKCLYSRVLCIQVWVPENSLHQFLNLIFPRYPVLL